MLKKNVGMENKILENIENIGIVEDSWGLS